MWSRNGQLTVCTNLRSLLCAALWERIGWVADFQTSTNEVCTAADIGHLKKKIPKGFISYGLVHGVGGRKKYSNIRVTEV